MPAMYGNITSYMDYIHITYIYIYFYIYIYTPFMMPGMQPQVDLQTLNMNGGMVESGIHDLYNIYIILVVRKPCAIIAVIAMSVYQRI